MAKQAVWFFFCILISQQIKENAKCLAGRAMGFHMFGFMANLFNLDNEINPMHQPLIVYFKRPTMNPEKVLE